MTIATREHWNNCPLPVGHKNLNLNIDFPADDMTRIKRGVLPREMEDKWFMFFEDDTLYCHRSWTGLCVYVARFTPNEDGTALTLLEVDDTVEFISDAEEQIVHQFLWLLLVLMFDGKLPLPGNGNLEADAVTAWSMAGRAYFRENDDE